MVFALINRGSSSNCVTAPLSSGLHSGFSFSIHFYTHNSFRHFLYKLWVCRFWVFHHKYEPIKDKCHTWFTNKVSPLIYTVDCDIGLWQTFLVVSLRELLRGHVFVTWDTGCSVHINGGKALNVCCVAHICHLDEFLCPVVEWPPPFLPFLIHSPTAELLEDADVAKQ